MGMEMEMEFSVVCMVAMVMHTIYARVCGICVRHSQSPSMGIMLFGCPIKPPRFVPSLPEGEEEQKWEPLGLLHCLQGQGLVIS